MPSEESLNQFAYVFSATAKSIGYIGIESPSIEITAVSTEKSLISFPNSDQHTLPIPSPPEPGEQAGLVDVSKATKGTKTQKLSFLYVCVIVVVCISVLLMSSTWLSDKILNSGTYDKVNTNENDVAALMDNL